MFPDFPEFIALSLELKEEYNQAVKDFPPYSDISFATLQIWWNLSEKLSVSLLNNNVIVEYSLPFDEQNSGLCLIGNNSVDESIDIIFDYLRREQRRVRLVHVPGFVVEAISDKSRFTFMEESDYNEYILDSEALAKMEGHDYKHVRNQVNRFIKEVEGKHIDVRELDLTLGQVQDHVFEAIYEWESKTKNPNDPNRTEHLALKKSMDHSSKLNINNLALYVDDKLHGLLVYHQPLDKEYFVIHHLKFGHDIPYVSDYLHLQIAKKAAEKNVSKINIEMDLGIENLRNHKLKLNPVAYLKKYTIEPS
jgi:hypothetical protein